MSDTQDLETSEAVVEQQQTQANTEPPKDESPALAESDSPSLSFATPQVQDIMPSDPLPVQDGSAGIDDGYARDKDGNVKLKADGTPMKKRGRKAGATNPRPEIAERIQNGELPETPPVNQSEMIEVTSATIIHTATSIMSGLIGKEWAIENKDEFNSLHIPLKSYLQSKNITDVPPGVLLTIAVLGYSMKRMQQPNTREKLSLLAIKAKSFFGGILGRFKRGE